MKIEHATKLDNLFVSWTKLAKKEYLILLPEFLGLTGEGVLRYWPIAKLSRLLINHPDLLVKRQPPIKNDRRIKAIANFAATAPTTGTGNADRNNFLN
jgi:hypothetical protein